MQIKLSLGDHEQQVAGEYWLLPPVLGVGVDNVPLIRQETGDGPEITADGVMAAYDAGDIELAKQWSKHL